MMIAQPLDFRLIIKQMMVAGLSRQAIALHSNIPRTSLFNYENGTAPFHHTGERLLALWCEVKGMPRSLAPVRMDLGPPTDSQGQNIFQTRKALRL